MKVVFIVRTTGACDLYRVVQPLQIAATQFPQHQFRRLGETELRMAAEIGDQKIMDILCGADIIVAPRIWGIKPLLNLRKLNPTAKIVYEYDDNLFHVSPFSPHYKDYGIDPIDVVFPGEKTPRPLWEDGKNINIGLNRVTQKETIEGIKDVEMVTVTTEMLKTVYDQWNSNVVVLPNCVNLKSWQRLPLLPHEGIRMGWFGGDSHYEDWCILAEILPKIMGKYPHVKLVLLGAKFDGTLKGVNPFQIEHHSWIDTAAYPLKAASLDLDFGIIPLVKNQFNEGKSAIKYLELAALKVPAVVSYVTPYREISTEDNGLWIEDNDQEAWKEGISQMIENKLLRHKVADAAYETVSTNFDAHKKAYLWVEAYENLLKVNNLKTEATK